MPTKKTRSTAARRKRSAKDTFREEYDFRGGVRGKYAARYPHGSIVVTLDPDVAAAYPSSAAANAALRGLVRAANRAARRERRGA